MPVALSCLSPTSMTGKHVLLAEDEFLIALGLQSDLEAQGAEVTVIDAVEDGMAIATHGFDIAVLDVRLADGDVYPLADRLVAAGVPIVFHSGHANLGDLLDRYPASSALAKPVWPDVLIRTVSASLSR